MSIEEKKNADVAATRLENIKLRNRLRRNEAMIRQKEELADGLHLIDFEQLKIENQTFNEKIEERNEELSRLKKKIISIAQVLSHVKEKLFFEQNEFETLCAKLSTLDSTVASLRDQLPSLKRQRDSLRQEILGFRQVNGLLGNRSLLMDYEKCVVGGGGILVTFVG